MKYRKIGNTELRASIVGFGGMRFFNEDERTAMATIGRALECGINLFETGVYYGDGKSEEWIGKALKLAGADRDKLVIANKAGVSMLPSGDEVRASLEGSLQREGVDYFDLFSFWGCNTREMFDNIMRPGGPLEAMLKAKDQGLVRAIGLTVHAQPDLILEFAGEHHWDCITLKEHILHSRQQQTITALGEMGTGVIVMSPLAGGVVALPGDAVRARLDAAEITAAQLGLRYLIANPAMTCAISGMTTPEEVDENVRAGDDDGPLSETERELADFLQERTQRLEKPFCTSCGYCLPCPQEVNIPGIFKLWNILRGYGNKDYSKLEYQKMREQRHWADFPGKSAEACVECGACEKRCPENLPIIEHLKRAHTQLTADA
ncbi:MAG: aldo/keto reductase [Lentisphaeria bacterium]|nr:aldo/keto reductase [Lentisphaeria bacterium]